MGVKWLCLYAVEEWQVIEMGAPPGDRASLETASDSPSTRARKRWKHAIKQQILLNYMEKENQLLRSKSYICMYMYTPYGTCRARKGVEDVLCFV